MLGAKPKFFPYAHEALVADEATLKVVSAWLDEVRPDIGDLTMDDPIPPEDILERLSGLGVGLLGRGPCSGGHELYWRGTIFGIAHAGEEVYFKVDDRSKGRAIWPAAWGQFRPNERQTLKSYYEVPPEVLDDPEALLSWAWEAIRAAQSSPHPR